MFGSSFDAWQIWSAAPVPRPPQPIRPTLSPSEPAAWAVDRSTDWAATAPPTTAVEVFKNSRRLEPVGSVMGALSWVKHDRGDTRSRRQGNHPAIGPPIPGHDG